VEPEEAAVGRQWLSKHNSTAMNTHATIGELLGHSVFCVVHVWGYFYVTSARKVGNYFFNKFLYLIIYWRLKRNEIIYVI
jgi:hypothetical protein